MPLVITPKTYLHLIVRQVSIKINHWNVQACFFYLRNVTMGVAQRHRKLNCIYTWGIPSNFLSNESKAALNWRKLNFLSVTVLKDSEMGP